MTRFFAIIGNTFREGIAKKTILTLLVLITIIIAFFLLALSIAGDVLFLFGLEINDNGEAAETIMRGLEVGVTLFFYQVAIFVCIFAIASFYPSMQEQGTIDLLLSRPMSRFSIFTAKFIGCMLVVLIVVSYLVLGTWAVFKFKTGIAHVEYLYTIPIFLLIFLAFMSFIALVGIISKSTTLSAILGIFVPYIFTAIFLGLRQSKVLTGHKLWRGFFDTMYWIFPKTLELQAWNVSIIARRPIERGGFDLPLVIWTTVAFAVVCYLLAAITFWRRSY
jgi:ABC-type transport system involved in multi-copper enzyme maturation permease subunit